MNTDLLAGLFHVHSWTLSALLHPLSLSHSAGISPSASSQASVFNLKSICPSAPTASNQEPFPAVELTRATPEGESTPPQPPFFPHTYVDSPSLLHLYTHPSLNALSRVAPCWLLYSGTLGLHVDGGLRAPDGRCARLGESEACVIVCRLREDNLSLSVGHYRCLQPVNSACEWLLTSRTLCPWLF